jgi:hypothetical protein
MLQSIGAVVAGYVVMAVLVMAGTMAWVATMVPGGIAAMRQNPRAQAMTPTPRYLAMNLVLSLVAAIAGGWVTARLGGNLVGLAAVLLVMGVVSAFMPEAKRQPPWYRYLIPVVGLAGIALSTLLTATAR